MGARQTTSDLPLFPLPGVVLFPGSWLPLHIFEPRYKELVGTVMKGDRRFGVLLWDGRTRAPAKFGCAAEIVDCSRLPDGRFDLITVGKRRFRVDSLHNGMPYLTGSVTWIEDGLATAETGPLADTVKGLLEDVLALSAKLCGRMPQTLDDLPTDVQDLSFWVAGTIYGFTAYQQELLEMQSTAARLARESDILLTLRNELAARTALKDAFES